MTRWRALAAAAAHVGCGTGSFELDRLAARDQVHCGVIDLLASSCPAASAEPVGCFHDAIRDGRAVTLAWRRFSVEGDPIVTSVFATPGEAGVVAFRDTRADAFGPQQVTSAQCDTVAVEEQCAWPVLTAYPSAL